jgi:transposase InsO family protein
MPWKEASAMGLRVEFTALASVAGSNTALLCRRFGISRKTGYKWLARYREQGEAGLREQSRRPRRSPRRTDDQLESLIVATRRERPAWGARKLRAYLERAGHAGLPSASTITEILRRHGLLDLAASAAHRPLQRFEHAHPNDLWQMDFKGHFGLENGGRCHPLTVLDDHSRFSICLEACGDERTATVEAQLTAAFRRYGLPRRVLADNGSPWGGGDCREHPYTPLTVWLLRLDVAVAHGRPYHPQTQGKEERFHRTLSLELLSRRSFRDLADCRRQFAPWRDDYNLRRPHQALSMETPADRYRPSAREYPERLPPLEYADPRQARLVRQGCLSLQGRRIRVGRAFDGYPLALEPTTVDGVLDVRFAHQVVGRVDLRHDQPRLERGRAESPGQATS